MLKLKDCEHENRIAALVVRTKSALYASVDEKNLMKSYSRDCFFKIPKGRTSRTYLDAKGCLQ